MFQASAKPASRVRFSPHHFGLVKACDTDGIIDAAESIAEQSSDFAETLVEEISNIKAGVALCSNPLDVLLCATKGVKEILASSREIVVNVKEYMNDMSKEVPALIADVKACL